MLDRLDERPTKVGALEVFSFSSNRIPVRLQLIDGEPWFVAKDVCQVLGIANHKDAVSRLDNDEKDGVGIIDPIGRQQTATVVSESGLYSLIFQSRKPEARKFRKWVTAEVLPSIRRRGYYGVRKASGDYIDVRDLPYQVMSFRGGEVRMVVVESEAWYSLNDINACIGSRTESSQSVRRLNAKQRLAKKLWLYGVPNPGWFVKELGVRLLLCASHKNRENRQLSIDFDGK